MKQKFMAEPGKMVLVREGVEETYSNSQIVRTEEARQFESLDNPWALVVGVGDSEISRYGPITTNCVKGDRVAFANVGRALELRSGDGSRFEIYVLPFDGVFGHVENECEACGHVERNSEQVMSLVCPECGEGKPDVAKIINASLPDIAEVNRSRG